MVVSEDEEFRRVSYDKFATLKPAFQKDNGEFLLVHWHWKSCPYCSLIIDNCCFSLQDWRISEVEHKAQIKIISLVPRAGALCLFFLWLLCWYTVKIVLLFHVYFKTFSSEFLNLPIVFLPSEEHYNFTPISSTPWFSNQISFLLEFHKIEIPLYNQIS